MLLDSQINEVMQNQQKNPQLKRDTLSRMFNGNLDSPMNFTLLSPSGILWCFFFPGPEGVYKCASELGLVGSRLVGLHLCEYPRNFWPF